MDKVEVVHPGESDKENNLAFSCTTYQINSKIYFVLVSTHFNDPHQLHFNQNLEITPMIKRAWPGNEFSARPWF